MNEIIGTVLFITEKEDKSKQQGKVFYIQDIGVETKDVVNGTTYKNRFKFQAKGDITSMLDNINVGDEVKVEFSIRCSEFKKKAELAITPKNPNHLDIIVNLQLDKITVTKKTDNVVGGAVNNSPKQEEKNQYKIGNEVYTVGVVPATIPTGYIYDAATGMLSASDLPF